MSGNINIAALHVVNAANIQVKGESNGIPAAATVNTGALASASAASSAAAGAAQESVQRAQQQSRQNLPSVISVQILGYGDEPAAAAPSAQPRAPAPAYRPDGVVQVQGSTAAAEIRLSVMPVSHRRVENGPGPGISGPWSVPAGLPRGAGAVT